MSGPATLSIAAGVLLDASVKATVVLAAAVLIDRVVGPRLPAAVRHAGWTVAFLALPACAGLAFARGSEAAVDAPWVVGIWLLGATVAFLSWLRDGLYLHRLRARLQPHPRRPDVSLSDEVRSPLTWGVLHPVVVMPTDHRWSREQVDAALAHERAHVARRDWLVASGVRGLCALFWFHPLVWVGRASLLRQAEHAADDVVLASGSRPSSYANLLLSLAEAPAPGGALGASSFLARRVDDVLCDRARSTRRWPVWVAAATLAPLFAAPLARCELWTQLDTTPTCQPAPGPLP